MQLRRITDLLTHPTLVRVIQCRRWHSAPPRHNAGSQLRLESIYLHDTAGLRNGLGVVKCLYQ